MHTVAGLATLLATAAVLARPAVPQDRQFQLATAQADLFKRQLGVVSQAAPAPAPPVASSYSIPYSSWTLPGSSWTTTYPYTGPTNGNGQNGQNGPNQADLPPGALPLSAVHALAASYVGVVGSALVVCGVYSAF